jgi:hypothetical protein
MLLVPLLAEGALGLLVSLANFHQLLTPQRLTSQRL